MDGRVYVGGIPGDISAEDLRKRLSTYGTVKGVEIPAAVDGLPRGFVFVDIEASEAQWKRCLNTLNGTQWKGRRVRIEPVKQTAFSERPVVVPKAGVGGKRKRPIIRHAPDMTPVTEKNVDARSKDRRWWQRGKYGRPLAMVRMRRPDGVLVTVDPSHYKDRYEKLFGSERPKALKDLTWFVEEFKAGVDGDQMEEEMKCNDNLTVCDDSVLVCESLEDEVMNQSIEVDQPKETDRSNELDRLLADEVMDKPEEIPEEPKADKPDNSEPQSVQLRWDQMFQEDTFRFTDAPVEQKETSVVVESKKTKKQEVTCVSLSSQQTQPATLGSLLHPDIFGIAPLNLFCLGDKTFEQIRGDWLRQRSELRRDFRRRSKQAKRGARKRATVQQSSSV